MKSTFRAGTVLCMIIAAVGLCACADDPANKAASTQNYQQDRAATGSNLVHHTASGSNGPDTSGITTYAPSGLPGGNGMPTTAH